MKKRLGKWFWIVLIIIIVLIIAGIVFFFFMNKSGLNFGGIGFDYSSGTKVIDAIGNAANENAFESAKLNPFANSTG